MRLRSLLGGLALSLASVSLAFGASPVSSGASIFPLTMVTLPLNNSVDEFNQLLILMNQQLVGLSTVYPGAVTIPSAGVDTSATTFSTNIQGNPLMQMGHSDVLVSTSLNSAAMATIIASETGRTIWPADAITIMASGTAATATGLALECSDGTFIASWPIAALTSNVPVGLYVSSTVNTLGKPLSSGCAASTALMLSNVGSTITTTTHVYVNTAYTVQ